MNELIDKTTKHNLGISCDTIEEVVECMLSSGGYVYDNKIDDMLVDVDGHDCSVYYSIGNRVVGVDTIDTDLAIDEDEQLYEGETGYDRAFGWIYSAVEAAIDNQDRFSLILYGMD